MYDRCRWMNHPRCVYVAENKLVQLRTAAAIGMHIPETIVTNCRRELEERLARWGHAAVKGLDTVLLADGEEELFGYTNAVGVGDIADYDVRSAPVIAQRLLEPKLDLRVTIVGDVVFGASVTRAGKKIAGDWRLAKASAEFREYGLPHHVVRVCRELVHRLGLSFAALDLAFHDGEFYFFEVNPTGEWAWLVDEAGLQIDKAIASYLQCTR